MSKHDGYLSDQEKRERLALLALAADREKSTGECPDDERFAEFLEADPRSAEQRSILEHLSGCDSCRQKWLTLRGELERAEDGSRTGSSWYGRRNLLGALGSAGAVALGVMLYLAIDYRPAPQESSITQESAVRREVGTDSAAPKKTVAGVADQGAEPSRGVQSPEPVPAGQPAGVVTGRQQTEDVELSEVTDMVMDGLPEPLAKSVQPETAAAPPRELESADREEKSVDAPPDQARPAPALAQKSFSGAAENTGFQDPLVAFFNAVADFCTEAREGSGLDSVAEKVTEEGLALLEFETAVHAPHTELIEEIIRTLQLKETEPNRNLDGFCEPAERVRDEITPSQQ